MSEGTSVKENFITVTIYGKALPIFGEDDNKRLMTLLNLLADEELSVKDLSGITDDEGTFVASFVSETPIHDLTEKALAVLENHTVDINSDSLKTWRVDIFHDNEAGITYDLEDPQYFQLDDDWNWGLTSPAHP